MLHTLTLINLRSTGSCSGLNGGLCEKVRILMPQTLHDAIQKALIAEEELISGGQTRTPTRPVGQDSSGAQQHQTPARHMPGYHGFQRGSTFTTPWRLTPQSGHLIGDHNITSVATV
jgi:hypothetical protein